MQYFLIETTFLVPFEKVLESRPAHRAFLQAAVNQGVILLAGMKAPPVGGLIIARADSQATVEELFAQDPFAREGIASYRYTPFNPGVHSSLLADWVQPA